MILHNNKDSMESNGKIFREGFRDGIPIGLGYFAVAFSLGIAAHGYGFKPLQGFIASILTYASAGQYIGFSLYAANATLIQLIILTVITNLRYILMGVTLNQRMPAGTPIGRRVAVGTTITDEIFGITPNEAVMHAMVVNYLANQRQGTQSTLTRTEVRGGGRKPWRQKGTGHARQGSIRAPQWVHGGVAIGPKPRDYRYSLNKKVKRLAMKSALSVKLQDSNLLVLDSIQMEEFKTKTIVQMLKALNVDGKALIVMPEVDKKVIKSASNIPGVKTTLVNTLNVYDILNYDKFIVVTDAVKKIEEVYA